MEIEHDIMTVTGFGHPRYRDTATLTLTTRRLRGHFVNATPNKGTGLLDTCDVDIDSKLETIGGVSVITQDMSVNRASFIGTCAAIGFFAPFFFWGGIIGGIIGGIVCFIVSFLFAKKFIKDNRFIKIGLPGETYQIQYPYNQHEEFIKFTNEFRRAKSVANA